MIKNTSNLIISSRVRLARNFEGRNFFSAITKQEAEDNIRDVFYSINEDETFARYDMDKLQKEDIELMIEKHLISKALSDTKNGAAIINDDETISIMVNEEDHLRLQCIEEGLNLENAYKKINKIDDKILEDFNVAYDAAYGFLTTCITNVGTGLRASVMIFLPALTRLDRINEILKKAEKAGLTIRGERGEGSKPSGNCYQISNETTLGISENEIIRAISKAANDIAVLELTAQEELLKERELETKDEIVKAYYNLKHGHMLSDESFIDLMATLKLGILVGLVEPVDGDDSVILKIDEMIKNLKPAAIKTIMEDKPSKRDEEVFRASEVRKFLQSLNLMV
jgi:protein arginine kinase